MRIQDGLAQAIPGPAPQRCDCMSARAEDRRDVGRGSLLDVGVPEDGARPLGQEQEPARHAGIGGAIGQRLSRAGVARRGSSAVSYLTREHPAEGGEQIRPEGIVWAAAGLDDVVHQAEGFGNEVVSFGR